METIGIILGVIVGTGVFFLLNSSMNITYMGCGAIWGLWLGCVFVSAVVVSILGIVIFDLLQWILLGSIIYAGIKFIKNRLN